MVTGSYESLVTSHQSLQFTAAMAHDPEDKPLAALVAPDILDLLEEAPSAIAKELEEFHPADLADVVELLPRDKVQAFLAALPAQRAADILEYVDEELRAELMEQIPTAQAAALVSQMSPDERTDLLDEMDADVADEIVSELPQKAREETEHLLTFDPDTAGGLMTTEFVSVLADQHVDEALDAVRALARAGSKEAMYAIRSEEHTSELQSRLHLVCRLLLEKKKPQVLRYVLYRK